MWPKTSGARKSVHVFLNHPVLSAVKRLDRECCFNLHEIEIMLVNAGGFIIKEKLYTYVVRRLSRSLASFARCLRQQMMSNASSGNPNIQDTMGMTIVSGATESTEREKEKKRAK